MRREGVVGQGLPVGEDSDAQLGREEGELLLQPLRVGRLGADDRSQMSGGRLFHGEARQQQRIGRADRARNGEALSWGEGGQLHGGVETQRPGAAASGRVLQL